MHFTPGTAPPPAEVSGNVGPTRLEPQAGFLRGTAAWLSGPFTRGGGGVPVLGGRTCCLSGFSRVVSVAAWVTS